MFMKQKLFTLLFALVTSVGAIFANGTKIGSFYYILYSNNTACVTYSGTNAEDVNNVYSGTISIPSSVTYGSVTYKVTRIGDHAFYRRSMTSVKIPNSITKIGYRAFMGNSRLTSVTFGNSVTSIENEAFYGCSSLASVTIPNSVKYIGEGAFCRCSSLESVLFGNNITSIEGETFSHCHDLTSIEIPNSVKSIGNMAFCYCGLKSVSIPDSVTTIGSGAFYYCDSMASVTIGNSVTSIYDEAFSYCDNLTSVTFGNSVTNICDKAFYGCHHLTLVEIPNSVKYIRTMAFASCSRLESVSFGDSVAYIGEGAFNYCTYLKNVTIPNSVTYIGEKAFSSCSGLKSVTIGTGVKKIEKYAFDNCSALKRVHISDIAAWCGIEFSICSNPLRRAKHLYLNDTEILDLVIPNSVTSIGGFAFEGCSGLKSVTIPNSVTSIGYSAFDNCTGLTSITIPNSVTSIGGSAFESCSSLKNVTIPNSVTSIGREAFSSCQSLKTITNYATIPQDIYDDVFNYVNKSIPLYVPLNSIDLYKVADGWQDFKNILPISAGEKEVITVDVETSENSASIVWPQVAEAYTYELTIKDKDGTIVCTLIFNAQGQLTSIAFNAPARGDAPQQAQAAGFSFTVTGLEAGTEYDLTITAKNENGQEIDKKNVSFHTNWPNGIEVIYDNPDKPIKVLNDGKVYIIRGEKVYTVQGQEVK